MGCSSSSDKLTDAEATVVKHFNSRDFAALINLLKQEPVDLFKLVSFNEDNPEDIKNGYDFIHTLLSHHQPSSSAVSILKAFKQSIESNKQKNATSDSNEKFFRENPQFDKFPYSYLQFVIFNNPQDLESFIFLLDNKETFPSPPPASQSLVHDLCSNPRAIELLRHLISSGEFPERFKNNSRTNNLDEQMRGSVNGVVIERHRSFTPLQAACAAVNKLAVQELCVSGLGGSNYGECAETLLTTAIAGEQDHNLGSMVLIKNENAGALALAQPPVASADDVSNILVCLLAQPNAHSAIREHRVQLSLIQSQRARDGVVAVFESHFNFSPEIVNLLHLGARDSVSAVFRSRFNVSSPLDTVNLMHLAFALYDRLTKNENEKTKSANNNNNNDNSSADTFLKTVLENKLAVCAPEELTLSSGILFSEGTEKVGGGEIDSALKKIEQYRLREWLISSKQELDLFSCSHLVDDETLRCGSSAFTSLHSLDLYSCNKITDGGLQHLVKLSSLLSLNLAGCKLITDSGLEHLAKMPSLQALNLISCEKITDNGLQHLAKLSSLQTLNILYCKLITDNGLEHLPKLSSLQSLNLGGCNRILDTGLPHLAKLLSLQTLNLGGCFRITDSGLQHLAVLSSLQSLDLSECDNITDSGLEHFTTKLPSTRIER